MNKLEFKNARVHFFPSIHYFHEAMLILLVGIPSSLDAKDLTMR